MKRARRGRPRVTGHQAADWLRDNCRVDVALSDHRRIEATLSIADDRAAADRLLAALDRLVEAAQPGRDRLPAQRAPAGMVLPDPADPSLETVRVVALP